MRQKNTGTCVAGESYYRARYYDPQSGRFISEDPIEFAGAMNFYAYVHNTPTNLVDPGGMSDACTFGNCGNRPRPPAPPPPPDLGGNINALGGIFPGSTPGPGKPPWSLFIPLPCDDVEKVLHAQGYITWDNWPYEFYNPLILWDPAAHSGGSEARTPGSGFHFRIHPDKLPCGKEGCTLDQFHMDLFNPIDHPIKHGMEFVGWALGKLLN